MPEGIQQEFLNRMVVCQSLLPDRASGFRSLGFGVKNILVPQRPGPGGTVLNLNEHRVSTPGRKGLE